MNRPLRLLVGLLLSLQAACDALDTTDPNTIDLDDLDNPAAAEGMVNGVEYLLARAYGEFVATKGVMSDELTGSLRGLGALDAGLFDNTANQRTDALFVGLAEARWLADEAVRRLDQFRTESADDQDLIDLSIRARQYSALVTVMIVESFEDFVLSDRTVARPPLGAAGMRNRLVEAIELLVTARMLSDRSGDAEAGARSAALEARARFALAVWDGLTPDAPFATPLLVADPTMEGAAADAIALGGSTWRWWMTYGLTTTDRSAFGGQIVDAMQFGESYVDVDPADPRVVTGIALMDPSTGGPDQRLASEIARLPDPFAALGISSGLEMTLILAEASLARGDEAGFRSRIDQLRALTETTPTDPAVEPIDLLEHERRVLLFAQGRRLLDHYRFGNSSDRWEPLSVAVTRPGTRLPITDRERKTNPHLNGGS